MDTTRIMRTTIVFIVFLSMTFSVAAAQRPNQGEGGPTTRPESGPVIPDKTRDEAVQWLERAVKAQVSSAKVPTIESYKASYQFRAFEYDENGKATEKPGDITQWWATKKTKDGKTVTAYRRDLSADVGDMGTLASSFTDVAWKLNQKTGAQVSMMTKDYERDRERLALEKRRCTQLLNLFFLSNIDAKDPHLRIVAKGQKIAFKIGRFAFDHNATVVETTDGDKNVIRMWIDEQSFNVVRASIKWAGGDNFDVIHFARHSKAKIAGTDVEVLLPLWIQYVEGDRVTIEVTALNHTGLELNTLAEKDKKKLFEFEDD